jgi:hypothetical protein
MECSCVPAGGGKAADEMTPTGSSYDDITEVAIARYLVPVQYSEKKFIPA